MRQLTSYKGITTAIFAIILIVTLSLFFSFSETDTRDASWWLSLSALVLAEVISYGFVFHMIESGHEFKASVPAYMSLAAVITIYDAAVLLHIVLFWLIFDIPFKIYLFIHILTLAAMLIVGLLLGMAKIFIRSQEADEQIRIQSMKQLYIILHGARMELDSCQHADCDTLRELLCSLEEQLKYSDPISHPALVLEEAELMEKVRQLDSGVRSFVRERPTLHSSDELRQLMLDIAKILRLRNERMTVMK